MTASLFGEGSGGFVVSGRADALRELAKNATVRRIGMVGGGALKIAGAAIGSDSWESTISIALDELARAHAALGELFS
jgi:hypothetical protein